jgi:histidine ammonia-lyase
VELEDGTREMIAAGREVVDHSLARDEAVYGLTTQVGHGKGGEALRRAGITPLVLSGKDGLVLV